MRCRICTTVYIILFVTSYAVLYLYNSLQYFVCNVLCGVVSVQQFTVFCLLSLMRYCICTTVLRYCDYNILCCAVSLQQLYSVVSVTSNALLFQYNSLQSSACITVCITVPVAQFTVLCLYHRLQQSTCSTVYIFMSVAQIKALYLQHSLQFCISVMLKGTLSRSARQNYIAQNFPLLVNLSSARQEFPPPPNFHSE